MTAPDGVVVFDLDDTLYLERDFVLSGFASVGRWLARERGIHGFRALAAAHFEQGRRGDIFDAALRDLGLTPDAGLIGEMVARYRRHKPRIDLAEDARRWLENTPPGWALALITDGPVDSQAAKVKALRLQSYGFEPILLTDRWGLEFRKPHPRAFRSIADRYDLPGPRYVYVADNAAKDFVTPNRLGWQSVQIRRPLGLHRLPPPSADHAPRFRINSLDEFDPQTLSG